MDNLEFVIAISIYSLLFMVIFFEINYVVHQHLENKQMQVDLMKIKNYENVILEDKYYGYVDGINLLARDIEKTVFLDGEYLEVNGSYGFGRLIFNREYKYVILGR